MAKWKWSIWIFMLPLWLTAQESGDTGFKGFDKAVPAKANKQFQAFVYFYQQNVAMNMAPENDFLKGQIVGRLFGSNTTTTSNDFTALYAEQRAIPFFVYSPAIFDGKATLRASFEIDWTWGDVAYGTGGNFGSAISADQVNLQTQNLAVEFIPAKYWTINVGLQRMYDTPHDLYRTFFEKFTTTGYRLAYFGTDGVGISVRRQTDKQKIKAGFYKLYENNVELNDDVTLFELNSQYNVAPKWNVGASVYWVKDNSSGKGGVSILGQGYASPLTSYNGTFRFPIGADPYQSDVFWLGTYFARNEEMMMDRFILSGFLNYNLGSIRQKPAGSESYNKKTTISGLAAKLRLSLWTNARRRHHSRYVVYLGRQQWSIRQQVHRRNYLQYLGQPGWHLYWSWRLPVVSAWQCCQPFPGCGDRYFQHRLWHRRRYAQFFKRPHPQQAALQGRRGRRLLSDCSQRRWQLYGLGGQC
mgnify:CR=1 FL=1